MNQSSMSMFFAAVYMAGLSLAFVLFPNPIASFLGFHSTDGVWVRVLGYCYGALAFYYAMAVRERAEHFYKWTAYGRAPIIILWASLVAAGKAPLIAFLLGLIESGSGTWTGLALRREKLRHLREMPSL